MRKKTLVWYCEDDESMWDVLKEELEEGLSNVRIKFFENAGYCPDAGGSPDFIIIDVGGAMGFGCNINALQRANIDGLAELHPGSVFIITSAVGEYARDLFDSLTADSRAVSRWVEYGTENIINAIKSF